MLPAPAQCPDPKIKLRSREWFWAAELIPGLIQGSGGVEVGLVWLFGRFVGIIQVIFRGYLGAAFWGSLGGF